MKFIETEQSAIFKTVKIYKLTECSHLENFRDNIIKHIKIKHIPIFSPANVTRPVPAHCSAQTLAANVKPVSDPVKWLMMKMKSTPCLLAIQ